MNSQEKWGLFFLCLAAILIIVVIVYPPIFPLLMYCLPLLIMGLALIVFRNREGRIDK